VSVVYDNRGNPVPYYVQITDGYKVNGPAVCHNDTDRIFDVEFLGVAIDCHIGEVFTMPCYLGSGGAIRTLDGGFVKCFDRNAGDCTAGQFVRAPNPVIRVHADLTGKNVYERRCPNINDVNIGPSTGVGYVPPPEEPDCGASFDCKFMKLVSFVDRWFGWVP